MTLFILFFLQANAWDKHIFIQAGKRLFLHTHFLIGVESIDEWMALRVGLFFLLLDKRIKKPNDVITLIWVQLFVVKLLEAFDTFPCLHESNVLISILSKLNDMPLEPFNFLHAYATMTRQKLQKSLIAK
jgi:hypothetical protein